MKARKNQIFLLTCSALALSLVWSYSKFVAYFAASPTAEIEQQHLAEELREERFQRILAESRLRDLSVEVAGILPRQQIETSSKLASLSKAVREPAAVKIDLSGVIFERAKSRFSEKDFKGAIQEFKKLREDFPTSPYSAESAFLAGEAAFLASDPQGCLEFADLMVEQYPESDLTGFLLLRVGQINESSGRFDEAIEIYRTVSSNFKNKTLSDQARKMARALEL